MKVLKIIRDRPGLDGDQIRHSYAEGDSQTANNIKLLEQHRYITWKRNGRVQGQYGWFLAEKGEDVLKYG